MQTIERFRPPVLSEFNRERMAIYGFDLQTTLQSFGDLDYLVGYAEGGRIHLIREPGRAENLFLLPSELVSQRPELFAGPVLCA